MKKLFVCFILLWGSLSFANDVAPQVVWNKIFTGSDYEFGTHAITKTSDGDFVVAGVGGRNDSYVMKLDSNGNKIWSKIFTGDDYDGGVAATEILW